MATSAPMNQDPYYRQDVEQELPPEQPAQRIKRKRNRVPVACYNCRALKTKCDSARPTCTTCLASGENCQYSSQGIMPSATSVMVNQEYLSSLERRLVQVERRASHDQLGDDALSHSGTTILPSTPSLLLSAGLAAPHSVGNHVTGSSMDAAVSSTGRSIMVSADHDVFMGGMSFTQLVLNAMNSRTVGVHAHSPNLTRDESFPLKTEELFELPPNTIEMLTIFLDKRHQLSPIFHVPTIWEKFRFIIECDVSERRQHRYTLAIMNMMFSICSSHQLLTSHIPPAIARRYYDIGIELLQPTLLQDWSLEKVQALVLGCRYLQSSNCPDECWNVLGVAIRIAYGLELHRPPPDTDSFNLQETKKRVWNACFTLDKLLSMIYSRPPAIFGSECSCPLPEDLDDDCILKDRLLRPNPPRPSYISFSIAVGKLYRIMEAATELSKLELLNAEFMAQSVVSLDERYQKWYNSLPEHLILNHQKVYEPPLILALRANMVRILIHRQSLALSLRGISDPRNLRLTDNIKSGMLRHSREICVKAAVDSIDIVSLRHESSQKATGPSWFNLYYLFNAILVLVSHVVDPEYHDDKISLGRLDMALKMIHTMAADHAFAQRAHAFLHQLKSFMNKSIPGSAHPNRQSTKWDGSPSTDARPLNDLPRANTEVYSQMRGNVRMPMNRAQEMGSSVRHPGTTDIYALYDYTQDLTQNLGDHLENFDSVGAGMWAWESNGFGAPQTGV